MSSNMQDATVLEAVAVNASGEPAPEVSEETWKWWSEAPDRLRVEFAVGDETVTTRFRGATWWSWSASQGARTNQGQPNVHAGKGPGEVMASPGRVARGLDVAPLGTVSFRSGPAYRVRARPEPGNDFALHPLGRGADE
ncbi:MAG: hypothetical protein ABSE77_16335 [Acidimicrobiales bacterium]